MRKEIAEISNLSSSDEDDNQDIGKIDPNQITDEGNKTLKEKALLSQEANPME